MEPRTSFVGRERELATLDGLVRGTQLVTLTGPGGIGKTRLASRMAERLRDEAVDGVFVVELAEVAAGASVAVVEERLLSALDRPSMEVAAAWLADATALIVLDNCEHLLDAAASLVESVLAAGPEVRIVATSRAPIEVDGEHVLVVEPLPPGDGARLLRDRAAAAGADLRAGHDADEELADLSEALDGMPLAVELAATRLRSMAPADVSADLASSAALLQRNRATDARHRSIRDTVTWSYDLLDPSLQELFRAVAVFPGWFRLDDVVTLLDAEPVDRVEVIDGLDRLVSQSLVQSSASDGRARYRLLVPIRHLALDALRVAGDEARLEQRMLDVLTARAIDLAARGTDSFGDEVMGEVFETAFEFRAAARRCIEIDDTPDRAFALYLPSYGVVHHRDVAAVARLGEDLLGRWPEPDWPLAAEVRAISATGHLGMADHDRLHERVAEVHTIAPPPSLAAVVAERAVALAAMNRADFDVAEQRAARGAEWASQLGLDAFRIELDSHRGGVLDALGRVDEAHEVLATALAESRAAGDTVVEVATLALLADHHLDSDADACRRYCAELDEILADYHQLDSSWSGDISRGFLHLREDDPVGAMAAMQRALLSASAAGDRRDTWRAVRGVAVIAVLGTDAVDAGSALLHAVESNPEAPPIGDTRREAVIEAQNRTAGFAGPLPADPVRAARALAAEVLSGSREPAAAATMTATGSGEARWVVTNAGATVTWVGEEVHVRPMKGLRDLAQLLRAPGRDVHALELMGSSIDEAGTGPTVDAEARRRYEDRLRELQSDIHRAEDDNDIGRLDALQAEFDAIVNELTQGLGLGGRDRPAGASAEKARQAVAWRIRSAIKRIEAEHPACGRHLRRSVKLGAFCRYDPEVDPGWIVEAG